MSLLYQNADGIEDRYTKTVILHGDEPVYVEQYFVRDPTGKLKEPVLHCRGIGPDFHKDLYFPVTDEKLRDGPFNLGYINGVQRFNNDDDLITHPVFVSRVPVRKFKQGLSAANLSFSGRHLTYQQALTHKGFYHLMIDQYPDLKACAAELKKKATRGVAFARRWAFAKNRLGQIELHYRNTPVGVGDDVEDVKLAKPFKFLQEAYDNAR